MGKPVLILLSLFIAGTVHAVEDLDMTIGSELPEQAFFSLDTGDGGLLVCGIFIIDVSYSIVSSESAGGIDCLVERLGPDGSLLWEADYFSGPWTDLAVTGVRTGEGTYVLAGVTTTMETGQQNWLFEIDDSGEVLWEETPGGPGDDWTYAMTRLSSGDLVLAGYCDEGYGPVVSITRTDSRGETAWSMTYGEMGYGMAEGIFETAEGDLMVCGYLDNGKDGPAPMLMRLSPDGEPVWTRTLDDMDLDGYALDMSPLGDGTVMLAGYGTTSRGDYDVWVGRMGLDGSQLGSWTFGGSGDDMAFSAIPSSDGLVIAGSSSSEPAQRNDLLLMCVSTDGEVVWSVNHGGPGNEGAEHITNAPGGGYYVSGYTSSRGEGDTDIWVLRVDGSGRIP